MAQPDADRHRQSGRRLARGQSAQIATGRQCLVLMEGPAGTGKTRALRATVGALDPLHLAIHHFPKGRPAVHWLAPYWERLPGAGETAIVFRGWYSAAVGYRRAGEVSDREWARHCDEINEFEAQQSDHGLILCKLYFDAPDEVRVERLAERSAAVGGFDLHEVPPREADRAIWDDMLARTDTRWAPWVRIDARDEQASAACAIEAVAARIERALPHVQDVTAS